jgi:hypothetical protein
LFKEIYCHATELNLPERALTGQNPPITNAKRMADQFRKAAIRAA